MYEALAAWLRTLPAPVALAVLAVASLALAAVCYAVSARVLRRVVKHTDTTYDDIVLRELRLPVVTTAALGGVALSGTVLELAPDTAYYLRAGGLSVVALVWGRGLFRLGGGLIRAVDERSERTTEFAPIFANVWSFLVAAGTGLAFLRLWEIDVTPCWPRRASSASPSASPRGTPSRTSSAASRCTPTVPTPSGTTWSSTPGRPAPSST
jgi:hypothetical protein